jgi:hypothetical protein
MYPTAESQCQWLSVQSPFNETDWQRFLQCNEPIDHSSKDGPAKTEDVFSQLKGFFLANRIGAEPRKDDRLAKTAKIGSVSASGPVRP